MDYNPKTFAEILNRAVGTQKKKDFAAQVGISHYYLSKLLHQNILRPPSMELLWKIAQVSDAVTYKELLSACGYTSKDDATLPEPAPTPERSEFAEATILTALKTLTTPWTIRPATETGFDLVIEFPEQNHICWYFQFLPAFQEEYSRQQRLREYYQLLCQPLERNFKYSIVTGSLQEYQMYTDQPPVNLNLNLSILLIQETTLQVQKEYWLSKSTPSKRNIGNLNLSNHTEGVCI